MVGTIQGRYSERVRQNLLERDPAQEATVIQLDLLREKLGQSRMARKSSALGWLFGSAKTEEPLRGLYIWGQVGRGKTMLMDLFFDTIDIKRKRRVHFHAFMADVHTRIHLWREKNKAGEVKGSDPIAPVATELAAEAWLLCFDEFSVTDIADAMILGRLFQALFAQGVVIVATSNVAPQNLYHDGLNRALFLPFIAMIGQHMAILQLDARTDFRLEKLSATQLCFTPLGPAATDSLQSIFFALTGTLKGTPKTLDVFGRTLTLPEAANNVLRTTFSALCDAPLGASDFVQIARTFHTLILDGVPILNPEKKNEIKRFILLIDALYDYRVKIVIAAAAPVTALYPGGTGVEAFEFDRTVSRLIEMQSRDYLALPHGSPSDRSGNAGGIVDT